MPHQVFITDNQVATTNILARQLIPGLEPGGSRAGEATKPALLILDAWTEPRDIGFAAGTDQRFATTVLLKLSQEQNLNPGLLLPVSDHRAQRNQESAVGQYGLATEDRDIFKSRGSIWAAKWLGIQVLAVVGTWDQFAVIVHLDYEVIDIPWRDWLLRWDFLDNVVDNERDY